MSILFKQHSFVFFAYTSNYLTVKEMVKYEFWILCDLLAGQYTYLILFHFLGGGEGLKVFDDTCTQN